MTLDEIAFELELAGLSREQQVKLLSYCKVHGYDAKELDQKLTILKKLTLNNIQLNRCRWSQKVTIYLLSMISSL